MDPEGRSGRSLCSLLRREYNINCLYLYIYHISHSCLWSILVVIPKDESYDCNIEDFDAGQSSMYTSTNGIVC